MRRIAALLALNMLEFGDPFFRCVDHNASGSTLAVAGAAASELWLPSSLPYVAVRCSSFDCMTERLSARHRPPLSASARTSLSRQSGLCKGTDTAR